jgi:UDP-glucose 4-epimerase
VSDVVRGIADLLERDEAVGEVFNIGSGEEISILELAHRVVALTGSDSRVELIPYEQAYEAGFEDMQRRVPDTTKLHNLIGWAPTRSLEDILTETMAEARREVERETVLETVVDLT